MTTQCHPNSANPLPYKDVNQLPQGRSVGRHLAQDSRLAKMVAERPALRVPGAWDGFELAVRAALGQQLTAVDAPEIADRLVQEFGQFVEMPICGLSRLFPRPEVLAEASFAGLGIPNKQAEVIRFLARAVVARKLTFDGYAGLEDTLARLRAITKVDEGVASYIAMRSLGEPDAFPYSDRSLRRALGADHSLVSPAELLRVFNNYRPWRAYAAMHLWAAAQQGGNPIQPPHQCSRQVVRSGPAISSKPRRTSGARKHSGRLDG